MPPDRRGLTRERPASALDAPSDPQLRLAHRAKSQSITPAPPTPAATPASHAAAAGGSSGQDATAIKRSQSAMSWADQRALSREENPIPGVDLAQISYDRDDRFPCGNCRKVLPRRSYTPRQLSQARSGQQIALSRGKDIRLSDLPLCDACAGLRLRNVVFCSECKLEKAASDFSHSMKRKSSGATCKVCQERLRNPIDTMPRADLEKDIWAAADGGVGSSDSEDEAIHEDLAAKRDVGDKALQSAYQVLETRPKGSKPVVICDSSDDDD